AAHLHRDLPRRDRARGLVRPGARKRRGRGRDEALPALRRAAVPDGAEHRARGRTARPESELTMAALLLAILLHTLPGATAFPESIGADPRTGAFFTGSLIDGTVYRGTLDAPSATVFLPAGSDGRTNVAGVKVDDQGRVWIGDAFNGRVL